MLQTGKAYFEIAFASRDTDVPDIETYIFVGKNIFPPNGQTDEYYFQSPYSYLKHGNFAEIKDQEQRARADVVLMKEDLVETLYSLSALITKLGSLRDSHPECFGDIPSEWYEHDA